MNDSLLFSLVELPRALGSVLERQVSWPVPGDFGTSSMAVSAGDVVDVDVTLTSVDDGVLVQLGTQVDLRGECVRCLDPVVRHHDVDVAEVFFESDAVQRFVSEDEEGTTNADDYFVIGERDTIDVESLLRDAVVTLVEELPLCSPDCAGLCPDCGEKWAELPTDHMHEAIDPRFAGLAALLESGYLSKDEVG